MNTKRKITPFMVQCYVTTAVSINMSGHGLVSGYSAVLLPQLRRPDSTIKVDESTESWIAAVFCVTFIIANLINPVIMEKFGRKKTNIVSVGIMTICWYLTVWSSDVSMIMSVRIIQGLAMGLSGPLCPTMIGEYTSPKNRGAFLSTVGLAISSGVLIVHTLGSYLSWRTTALICAVIMTVDLIMVLFCPETPSWLINQQRYEEAKPVFRLLRESSEEEELEKMIEAKLIATKSVIVNKTDNLMRQLRRKLDYFTLTVKKSEFYIPIIIVIHIYALTQWGGVTTLSQFTPDILELVSGDVDTASMTVLLTSHRVISGVISGIFMKKYKRRALMIGLSLLAIAFQLLIAGYTYTRTNNMLPYDHPVIGIIFIHCHMFSICSGPLALGFIIAGEIFPLEYRSLAGGLSNIFIPANMFVISKNTPYLFARLGLPIAYCIYAGVSIYCLVVIWILLPETKGRTLQDIEDGFRGHRRLDEVQSAEPLTVIN